MSWLTSTLTNIGGTLLGNKLQGNSAKANAELSLDSWKYMQSNKHQLEVEDLRKAGLNPILSAGQGSAVSAPSVSGNPESQLGKNISDSITAAKQLKIAEKEVDIKDKEAETNLLNAKNQERLIDSQIPFFNATSSKVAAEEQEIFQNIYHSIERHQYELENLASQTEYNRSLTAEAYSNIALIRKNIDLVSEQIGLTRAQKEDLQRKLDDPRAFMNKEFWYDVKNSDDPMYKAIRASYQRGLVNDILYNFYSAGSGSNLQDAESIARIAGQLKYIATKGR